MCLIQQNLIRVIRASKFRILIKHLFANIPIIGTFTKTFPMARNTSVLLGEHFEKYISGKVSSGKYNSVSEVIRTALRLLEREEQTIKELNTALSRGERSGMVKDFDPKTNLKKLHTKFL